MLNNLFTQARTKPVLLIVDDQPSNIQVLFEIFKDECDVCMATNGADAIVVCLNRQPDLILLDVVMPVMDGHAVCKQLKADPQSCDIPIIFITSQSDPSDEYLCLELGAVDFISKPVNAPVVRARVRTHLELRSALHLVRDLNDNLETRVAQRTTELEQAYTRVREIGDALAQSESKATLSTLIASVSHELATPIGNSTIVASTLVDQHRAITDIVALGQLKKSHLEQFIDDVGQSAGLMQSNLNRAVKLLGDFRQVAADQASEQRRTFDLATVVNEIIHSLSPGHRRQPHRIKVDIPDHIQMDSQPGPLGQIIINLINNAYLHAFEGRSDGVLTISGRVDGDQVLLEFSDNGVGMTSDQLKKCSSRFLAPKLVMAALAWVWQ